jgi:hypothetical protein
MYKREKKYKRGWGDLEIKIPLVALPTTPSITNYETFQESWRVKGSQV